MTTAEDRMDLVDAEVIGGHSRTNCNKQRVGMLVFGIVCFVVIAVLLGVVIRIATNKTDITEETCTSAHCVVTAGKILEKLDTSVDPCDDFYAFSCGSWLKRTAVPDDKNIYGTFTTLSDQVEVDVKVLLEKEETTLRLDSIEAIRKVKTWYASCLDLETIDSRNATPIVELLNDFGGWPLLGDNDGGNWNQDDYDFETLAGRLRRELGIDTIFASGITKDEKYKAKHILYVDTIFTLLGITKEKFLRDDYEKYIPAYAEYMTKLATLLGANETSIKDDVKAVLDFEIQLSNITSFAFETEDDDESDIPRLYIYQLEENIPQIHWLKFFNKIMPDGVDRFEEIQTPRSETVSRLARLAIDETPKRVLVNYMMWKLVFSHADGLSKEFRDAKDDFYKARGYYTSTVPSRWRTCVKDVNQRMSYAVGRLYVDKYFTNAASLTIDHLVGNLKSAFKDMLKDNDWMDKESKAAAREKCDAIKEYIGYPEWIKEDDTLNYNYEFDVKEDTYFENILNSERDWNLYSLGQLRKEHRNGSVTITPTEVNAYYDPTHNDIVFPAAILQPPFYHKDSPWYLNYGGIGTVIGHEITHGFDNNGRLYDKDGIKRHWWTNSSIDNFREREQCIIDQYSQYVMPENKNVNGSQTQGENIADNGGVEESFKAYTSNGYSDPKLPGLEEFSPEQLFFINFGQLWCGVYTPKGVDEMLEDEHSPGRFRVIGTLHNLEDFSKTFNCPANSNMNPPEEDKCVVW